MTRKSKWWLAIGATAWLALVLGGMLLSINCNPNIPSGGNHRPPQHCTAKNNPVGDRVILTKVRIHKPEKH